MRERAIDLLKVGLSLGLLALILREIGWREILSALQGAQLSYLAVAFAISLAGILLRAHRWQVLLAALGMEAPLSRLTELYFVGTFFNSVLPTGIGGDVVRIYELSKESDRPTESIGTVLLDRATGFLALFLMATAAPVFSYRLIAPSVAAAILLLFLASWAGSWVLLQRDRLESWGLLKVIAKLKPVREIYEAVYACGLRAIGGALADNYGVLVPSHIPPGEYQIEVGMYDLETMQRIPAFDEQGTRLPSDRILLRKVRID